MKNNLLNRVATCFGTKGVSRSIRAYSLTSYILHPTSYIASIRVLTVLVIAALVATAAAAEPVDFTSKSALMTLGVQEKEVSVGDLAADAVRRTGRSEIAFVAASELKEVKEEIPAGKVSSSRIIELLSYPEEQVVVVRLTGAQIKSALEKSVSAQPRKNMGFLQVSGLKFEFEAKGSGDRVRQVTVGDQPLAADRNYEVAMSKSLGNGALGYWRIWGKDNIVRETKLSMAQSIEAFLSAAKTVDYSKTDRIIKRS